MVFPNFLVGGPPKCASTSLYFYLKQHPDIFMSPVKQTRFFSEKYNEGTQFYVNTYFSEKKSERMAGEATPGYFCYPFVVERIHNFNPEMKLIFCFRNPVERAFSGWNMRIENGTEKLPFQQALKENLKQRESVTFLTEPDTPQWKETLNHTNNSYRLYIEGSLYAFNLKHYYRFFRPEQIKIIFIDALKNDFEGTMKSIFSFLGVNENYVVENAAQQHTARTGKIKSAGSLLRKAKRISGSIHKILPKSFKQKLLNTMFTKSSAEGSKAKLTHEDRLVAYEIFKDDIAELEQLLNTDLSHWKYTS